MPFSLQSLATAKDLLIQEQTEKYTLRAKTGWSDAYKPQVGWWVGYVERGQDVYFFATEIDIRKGEDVGKRIELSKAVLKKLEIIEQPYF